jgi:hypothetical protein
VTETDLLMACQYVHHPRFVGVHRIEPYQLRGMTSRRLALADICVRFSFEPFGEDEPLPQRPPAAHLTPHQCELMLAEYAAATHIWHFNDYARQLKPILAQAVRVWPRYYNDKAAVDSIYRGLTNTDRWNQDILRLLHAHASASAYAKEWGDLSLHIETIVASKAAFELPEPGELVSRLGIDEHRAYWKLDRWAYTRMRNTINEQKAFLREGAALTAMPRR